MPKVPSYLKGFDLKKGDVFADFEITNISIEHHEIKRFREYQYPTVIDFEYRGNGKPDPQRLLDQLHSHLAGEKVIYTRYGNPYSCYFYSIEDLQISQLSSDQKKIQIEGTGYCSRI
jgi:hypothetical protein